MADNRLPILPPGIKAHTRNNVNDNRSAQQGDLVPRGEDGTPRHNAASLGTPARPLVSIRAKRTFPAGMTLAQLIRLVDSGGEVPGDSQGAGPGGGIPPSVRIRRAHPFFLRKGVGNRDLQLFSAAAAPLSGISGDRTFSFTAPLNFTIATPPAVSGSVTTDVPSYATSGDYGEPSRTMGETPFSRMEVNRIPGLGNGEPVAFRIGITEYLIAQYSSEGATSFFVNAMRGAGRLTQNDFSRTVIPNLVTSPTTFTRISLGSVFLDATGASPALDVSYRAPRYVSGSFPASGAAASGDYAWDIASRGWYRFDGVAWVIRPVVFCGFVFLTGSVIVATAPVWSAQAVLGLRARTPPPGTDFDLSNLEPGETLRDRAAYFAYQDTADVRSLTSIAPYYVSTASRAPGFMTPAECLAQRFENISGVDRFHPDGTRIYTGTNIMHSANGNSAVRDWDLDLQQYATAIREPNGDPTVFERGNTFAWNTSDAINVSTGNARLLIYVGGVGGLMSRKDGGAPATPVPDTDEGNYG